MKLKCIGGERDGEWFLIDTDRYRLYDSVQIPEKPKLTNFRFTPGEIPNVSTQVLIYQISCFNFSKDDVYMFLIPEGWSNSIWEIINV